MPALDTALQRMLDKECTKAATHTLLLGACSGDGRIRFRGAAGAADPNARFYIASITKMFTATVIMQLVDEGTLDLEEAAQSYLPDIDLSDLHVVKGVAHGPALTLRQLIHQTSGLADYFEGDLLGRLKLGQDVRFDLADVLTTTKRLPPQAAPDSGMSYYSDSNYQLLGAIIEAVTGQSFAQIVQHRICAPLGLTETTVCSPHPRDTNDVLPLFHGKTKLGIPMALFSMGPDGGIVSTLDDLMVFLKAFHSGQLFKAHNQSDMQQWNRLFFPLHYGYGLMRFKLPRWMNLFRETPELIGHSGASGSFAFYAPQQDIFLVGTFNQLGQGRRTFDFMMRALRCIATFNDQKGRHH